MPSVCSIADVPQQSWHIVSVLCCCLCPREVCQSAGGAASLAGVPQPRDVSVCPTASPNEWQGRMWWRTETMLKPHHSVRRTAILCLIDAAVWHLSNCLPLFLPPESHIPRDMHTACLHPPPTPSPGCDAHSRKQRVRFPKAEYAPLWAAWKEK